MPIFQNSVVAKYLQTQDTATLNTKWEAFKAYFKNPERQNNIRGSKEEQFQEGFLRELFVTILGYTLNPEPNFNLTTEHKNVKDSKKADGAILIDNQVKAVIELKGTDTTDLGKVETQAFGYKNNQPDCVYVITSNFEKIRFYIDNAIEHLEFNLFALTKEDFDLLYLVLAHQNISKGLAKKLKEESISQEDKVTKELYKDYSLFKKELHHNLVALNPEHDALLLFKKSQKLLDRLLFLLFGEDRGLLPPNSVRLILDQWNKLKDLDEYIPLYDRFKKYFGYLNTGFKGKHYKVFAFNGGLFKPDEVLDAISIDDQLLHRHSLNLAKYDFASEVDVNILGHIFENSLNEIDEIKAELEGQTIDKSTTKRKKDGVFYTPKYITKYIVENTVGKLCEAKRPETPEGGFSGKLYKKRKKAFLEELKTYREWLLQVKIVDPACGSGAFLNEALDFLIQEHKLIDELQAKLFGDSLVLSDIENSILENNLYGVDINEESVHIAKLSLWLRTAQPNRKLNDLNHNIKCGNSLIADPEVAGAKAFDWEKEFPQVFANGGFDVVIGNPPYLLCQPSNTEEKLLTYYKSFEVSSYKIDLFHLFFEKSVNILNRKGKLGFITPNTYLTNKYIQPLRNFILKNVDIDSLTMHQRNVFSDASVDVSTIILSKPKKQNNEIQILQNQNELFLSVGEKLQENWANDSNQIFNVKKSFLLDTFKCVPLGSICNSYFGIQAYSRKKSISETKKDKFHLSIIDGGDIFEFAYAIPNKYFDFREENIKSGGSWDVYKKERIVIRQIGQIPIVGISKTNILASNTLYSIYPKNNNYNILYILCILNSQLIKKIWLSKYSDSKQLFPKIKGYQLKELPIKIIPIESQQPFIKKADQMLSLNSGLQEVSGKFTRSLRRKFDGLEKLPKKLENWHGLSYAEFIKALKKKKISLSLSDEAAWEDYFLQEQQKAQTLQTQIDQTDREIDQMVYALYGLNDEETAIVAES